MSNTNAETLNALRTLFGVRAASRLFKRSRGRASHILEEARASYGAGWDAIRAVHALLEQAFLDYGRCRPMSRRTASMAMAGVRLPWDGT